MAAAVMGLLILAIVIVFMLLYHDAPQSREVARKPDFSALRAILRNRSLVVTILWGAIFVGLQFVVLTYFMLYLIDELQFTAIVAGGMLAIAQVSSGISRLLWGVASDFIFHGRRLAILTITGLVTVIWLLGSSVMGAGIPMPVVFSIAIVIGISTISFHGVYTTLVGELAGEGQVGITVGVTSMMFRVAMMVMPPLFGYIIDVSGYSLAWRVAAAVALVTTLALLAFGREPQRRQLSGIK